MKAPDESRSQNGFDRKLLGQVLSLGSTIAGAHLLGFLVGAWLDRAYGSSPWGMACGLAGAVAVSILVLWRFLKSQN